MRYLGLLIWALLGLSQAGFASAAPAAQAAPQTVAFLGLYLQNDNEALEPTSASEKSRIDKVAAEFKSRLDESGRYDVRVPPPQVAAKIRSGQTPGACNGCEIAYAKETGGDLVAWITVQKVSNLILNMNVYIGNVKANKLIFVHSVDIRGNTDESWTRSLNYLLDNYLFAEPSPHAATQ